MKTFFRGFKSFSWHLFLVIFLLAGAMSARAAVVYHITGTVQDSNGNPIKGVGVMATLSGATNYVYTDTATNGTYSLSVSNGTWDVSVNCSTGNDSLNNVGSGYLCCNDENVTVSGGNKVANFSTPPFGYSELSGNLYDASNNPVANVTVYASDTNDYPYLSPTATTDANGFYQFNLLDGYWDISVNCTNLNSLGFACVNDQIAGVGGGDNVAGVNFIAQSSSVPAPFFNGQVALGSGVYFLANTTNSFFGYYSTQNFPYVYNYSLGFEYFFDASNSQHGAYLYDFTSGHFWYTAPLLLPFFYDFNFSSWLYCYPDYSKPYNFLSNPRVFNNLTSNTFWFD